MKKVLKVLFILSIFFVILILFMTVDCKIMLNDFDNNIPEDNGRGYGLGIIFVPIVSTWKFAFLMTILAICAKFSKKLDSTTKTTIYFLPIISLFGFFIVTDSVLWLMNLLWN